MTIGEGISDRLRRAGYHVCDACREVIDAIDRKGAAWCEEHVKQLSRMINANLRNKTGRVPHDIRKRWIRRQITLAIKQARKDNDDVIHRT